MTHYDDIKRIIITNFKYFGIKKKKTKPTSLKGKVVKVIIAVTENCSKKFSQKRHIAL